MITSNLCGPALIYLTFSFTQVVIDTIKGFYNTALFKFIISFIITILLNALCIRGLTAASWVIVFIPFITMTVITSLLLYYFDLDPASGTINISTKSGINSSNGVNPTYKEGLTTLTATNEELSCDLPIPSVNGSTHPNGCAGAVWSSGAFSNSYCTNSDGRFPWYAKCCKVENNNCVSKNKPGSIAAGPTLPAHPSYVEARPPVGSEVQLKNYPTNITALCADPYSSGYMSSRMNR